MLTLRSAARKVNKSRQSRKSQYCGETHATNTTCVDGHYVCDRCHSLKGQDLIETYCINTSATDPWQIAVALMNNLEIKMHGPEHHFLVPAVMIAAYHNSGGEKAAHIKKARQRAEKVPGGFCGSHGDCGAAVGTGILVSVLTGATPLSKGEWRLANLMTAKSLFSIASHGGPRCCKRNSFLAILEATDFVREHLGADITVSRQRTCSFAHLNRECLGQSCPFNAAHSAFSAPWPKRP